MKILKICSLIRLVHPCNLLSNNLIHVPSQGSVRSCMCVIRGYILPLSTIFLLNFLNWSGSGAFVFNFHFYNIRNMLMFQLETSCYKQTLENTEWAIKNGQSRETGNIGHTRHRKETNKAQSRKQKKFIGRCVKKWVSVVN